MPHFVFGKKVEIGSNSLGTFMILSLNLSIDCGRLQMEDVVTLIFRGQALQSVA